ncbi:MAG: ASKHA domain-containing protein [Faecalibacterium sp.]
MAQVCWNGAFFEVALGIKLSQVMGLHPSLELPCAEQGRCGKCRVVASGALSPLSGAEQTHLSAAEQAAGVRLACQCTVQGDCTVQTSKRAKSQVRVSGVMPQFALVPLFAQYGIAVDIGTTTLAAQLYDASGNLLAQASGQNPQVAFGADVISRIEGALSGKGKALADAIRGGVSALITQLCQDAQISPLAVEQLVVTGNTAMLYLLTEKNPEALSHAPFAADCLFGIECSAKELDFPCQAARVYLPPCMSAFVGADITTALLASELCTREETALLADIGTNGEMALWHKGRLYCCSTAAGPAFEGAGLSMGMGGKDGAIDKVTPRAMGGYDIHVLGEVAPQGICGSGVIDALAAFLAQEEMDETGLLEDDFVLLGDAVQVSQADVRMVQLAKSAICAGMLTLVAGTDNLSAEQVSQLFLAGGFGSYIDLDNAATIGLIPPEYLDKTQVIGNAALSGAVMLLLNHHFYNMANTIAQDAITIDLSTNPRFSEAYMMGMMFGEE